MQFKIKMMIFTMISLGTSGLCVGSKVPSLRGKPLSVKPMQGIVAASKNSVESTTRVKRIGTPIVTTNNESLGSVDFEPVVDQADRSLGHLSESGLSSARSSFEAIPSPSVHIPVGDNALQQMRSDDDTNDDDVSVMSDEEIRAEQARIATMNAPEREEPISSSRTIIAEQEKQKLKDAQPKFAIRSKWAEMLKPTDVFGQGDGTSKTPEPAYHTMKQDMYALSPSLEGLPETTGQVLLGQTVQETNRLKRNIQSHKQTQQEKQMQQEEEAEALKEIANIQEMAKDTDLQARIIARNQRVTKKRLASEKESLKQQKDAFAKEKEVLAASTEELATQQRLQEQESIIAQGHKTDATIQEKLDFEKQKQALSSQTELAEKRERLAREKLQQERDEIQKEKELLLSQKEALAVQQKELEEKEAILAEQKRVVEAPLPTLELSNILEGEQPKTARRTVRAAQKQGRSDIKYIKLQPVKSQEAVPFEENSGVRAKLWQGWSGAKNLTWSMYQKAREAVVGKQRDVIDLAPLDDVE